MFTFVNKENRNKLLNMKVFTLNKVTKNMIYSSVRKNVKLTVNMNNKIYSNHSKAIDKMFEDIVYSAECCVSDFPEADVFFRVIDEETGEISDIKIHQPKKRV